MELVAETPQQVFKDSTRDQRIIEVTFNDDAEAMRGLAQQTGARLTAIRARARKLGLNPSVIRACRLAGTRPAIRSCLRCDDRFLSRGKHNRMCKRCARRA